MPVSSVFWSSSATTFTPDVVVVGRIMLTTASSLTSGSPFPGMLIKLHI
jgi:hypothetical protein